MKPAGGIINGLKAIGLHDQFPEEEGLKLLQQDKSNTGFLLHDQFPEEEGLKHSRRKIQKKGPISFMTSFQRKKD